MANSSLSGAGGLIKRVYDDYVESQQNLKARAMDEISKSLEKYSPGGEGFFGAINDYGNEAVGAINESEAFRSIDAEHYSQYKVIPKINVAPIEFTGLFSKATDGDDEAFAKGVVDALDRARERLLKDENRQFYGYGFGVLAAPGATASDITIITVDSVQYLKVNQVLDFFSSTGGAAKSSSARISAIDRVNSTITLAASLGSTMVSQNVIVKENVLDSVPSDGKEMMGLRGIIDDATDLTTFQNINASTNTIWQSRRLNASSANLSSDLIQRLCDDVQILGGEMPDTLIIHPKQRRKYLDIVVPQKRYNDQKLDAGFQKLEFNGMELWVDVDCQSDTLYAIKKSLIKKFELAPLHMGSHDGSDPFLRATNYDIFQAYWRHYCNLGTSKRNAHGKIVSLAVPSGLV